MRAAIAVCALLSLALGCGGDSDRIARVSGRVTLNGQPLANAAVTFQPVYTDSNPGPGSGGVTDADGHYTLTVVGTGSRGALIGKHKVRVTMFQRDENDDDKPQKRAKPLPARYNGKNTTLEFDVPAGGSDTADFKLTAP